MLIEKFMSIMRLHLVPHGFRVSKIHWTIDIESEITTGLFIYPEKLEIFDAIKERDDNICSSPGRFTTSFDSSLVSFP